MRRIQKKGKKKTRSNTPKWLFGLTFILIVVQVILANSLVTKGKEINQLNTQRKKIQAEIVSLENRVSQVSSLAIIRQKARQMGMKPGKVEFLPPPSIASAP